MSNFKEVGKNLEYSCNGKIFFAQEVSIGDNCYIGPEAYWYGQGGIEVGNGVIFGPKTVIWTTNHDHKTADALPYGMTDILSKVVIEDYCWIGFGVAILPGVRIGEGAILALNTVVTKDVPPLSIVAGNPGKIVGERDSKHFENLKKNGKYQTLVKRMQPKKIRKLT
ncbi:acyltransferase [Emcibacteraceae bacterium]|nr:acyltransferase [Emcibacteraceae bacterium]